MRRWTEIVVTLPAEAADSLGELLLRRGAPGTIEEEAGPGRVRLRAHFEAGAVAVVDEVHRFLAEGEAYFPGCAAAIVESAAVTDEDWAEGWKQSFPPLALGSRLLVRPPWEAPVAGRLDVVIEPAMAFGTGQHATTAGCLLALEEIFGRAAPPEVVLDVGTGSGILAIAAARLGARQVVALDNDPVAVAAALENVRRNGLEERISVCVGTAESASGRFPLIVANLYSLLLRDLLPVFAEHAAERCTLLVSGFLDADCEPMVGAARAHGFAAVARRSIEGWSTTTFQRDERIAVETAG